MQNKLVALFKEFEKLGIEYCVFKSLERLEKDLAGKGDDIDILCSISDVIRARKALGKHNFRRVLWPRSSKGITMYMAYDFSLKKTVYVHMHTQLRIGPKPKILGRRIKLKQYRWDYEKTILKRRVSSNLGVQIINPVDEFFLLHVRTSLKGSCTEQDYDRLKYLLKKYKEPINKCSLYDQYTHYIGLCDSKLTEQLTKNNLKKVIKNSSPKSKKFLTRTLRKKVRSRVIEIQEIVLIAYNRIRRLLNQPERCIRRRGFIVALQGIDGSGKSTQAELISLNPFLQKTGVKVMYGGHKQHILFLAKSKNEIVSKLFRYIDRRLRQVYALVFILRGFVVVFDRYFFDDFIRYEKWA